MKEWATCNVDKLVKVWEKLGRELYAVCLTDDYTDYTWDEFAALADCDKDGVWALAEFNKSSYYITTADVKALKLN